MALPKEHIDKILAEINVMASDGHLNDFDISVFAGAVEHEVGRMADRFEQMEKEEGEIQCPKR